MPTTFPEPEPHDTKKLGRSLVRFPYCCSSEELCMHLHRLAQETGSDLEFSVNMHYRCMSDAPLPIVSSERFASSTVTGYFECIYTVDHSPRIIRVNFNSPSLLPVSSVRYPPFFQTIELVNIQPPYNRALAYDLMGRIVSASECLHSSSDH